MPRMNQIGTHRTTVRNDKDGLSVTYHQTEVVHQTPGGTITLDSGGWRTPTTKNRINQAANQFNLGFALYQNDFNWYVAMRDRDGKIDWENATAFVDGMKFEVGPPKAAKQHEVPTSIADNFSALRGE